MALKRVAFEIRDEALKPLEDFPSPHPGYSVVHRAFKGGCLMCNRCWTYVELDDEFTHSCGPPRDALPRLGWRGYYREKGGEL